MAIIADLIIFDDKESVGPVNTFDFSTSDHPNDLTQVSHFVGVRFVSGLGKFEMIAKLELLKFLGRVFIKD